MGKIITRCIEAPEMIRSESNSRVLTFVASDGTRDSARSVLNPQGWDLRRFNRNGIIGYQHDVYGGADPDPDKVIGKGRAYTQDNRLLVEVEFEPADLNPLAEKIYQKLLFGSLKAVSVGFMPVGKGYYGKGEEAYGGENETYYYDGQELLEVSVVNIPANPNALKRALEQEIEGREAEEPEAPEAPEAAEAEPEEAPAEAENDNTRKENTARELALAAQIARAALL